MVQIVAEFGLKKGMKGDEVLNELRGRTSGESRQELVQVFGKDTVTDVPFPRHEIIEADREYALLRKTIVSRDRLNGIDMRQSYYLCGINDENKYFVHPFDTGNLGMHTFSMEEAVAWTNRADEGYSMRIQGDVLLRFLPRTTLSQAPASEKYRGEFTLNFPEMSGFTGPGPRTTTIGLDSIQKAQSPIVNLGNHAVSTDGEMFMSRTYGRSVLVVAGSNIVLQHPEHGAKTVQIPKDHVAVLTGQRGRSFNVQGATMTGFD